MAVEKAKNFGMIPRGDGKINKTTILEDSRFRF
jgi:hypothetical protein